jgi:hypothetical protein
MPRDSSFINDVATGDVRPFEAIPIPQTSSSRLVTSQDLHRQVRALVPVTSEMRRRELVADWENQQHAQALQDGANLLLSLSEYGMAWRDVARLVKVSVPAVQKWRRGEGITGENRLRLAGVVALLACLEDKMVNEPVSWLEMPVLRDVSVSAMDMVAADRYDLVLELAADDPVLGADRLQILDEFEPHWRTTRVDDNFEVFEAEDGVLSIRPRR